MGTQDRLGQLRAALYMAPGGATWRRACDLLDRWPADADQEVGIDYVDAHLKGWDDSLRVAPLRWLLALEHGHPAPQIRVARAIALTSSDPRGREILERVSSAAPLAPINTLSTREIKIGDRSLARIVGGPLWHGLRRLTLQSAGLEPDGAATVARSGGLEALEALSLAGNAIEDKGLKALVDALQSPRLSSLDLTGCGLGAEAAEVASAPWAPGLRRLELGRNGLTEGAAAALGASTSLGALAELSLSANPLEDQGVASLSRGALGGLEGLDLSLCRVADPGALALARGFERLRALRLANNPIGPQGVEALVEAPLAASLEVLDLSLAALGAQGARAIGRAGLAALRVLSLGGCLIGDEGARALVDADGLASVRHLDLSANGIDLDGLGALIDSPLFEGLEHLDLGFNDFNAAHVELLLRSPHLSSLRVLRLMGRGLGDDALKKLAACPALSNLLELHLDPERANAEGLQALIRSPHLHPRVRAALSCAP